MFVALEAPAARDRDRLSIALSRLGAEDPAPIYGSDPTLDRFFLYGASETELEGHFTKLRAACGFDPRLVSLQVTYIEKPLKRAEIDYALRKAVERKFARVTMILEPASVDRPVTFARRLSHLPTPEALLHAVENGILAVAKSGIHGFPVRGVDVALLDLASDENSTPEAFEEAASAAVRESLRKSGVVFFEPLMKVSVTTPEAYEGSVAGDMLGRRAQILDRTMVGPALRLTTIVPLANMFGYANQLRSFTQGHGTFSMRFDRYEEMPPAPSTDPPFPAAAALRVA